MSKTRLIGSLLFGCALHCTAAETSEKSHATVLVRASETGAVLDSDLARGGGTDDTAALQRVLNRARAGRAVHLIVDGPARISGLDVYSNTIIECTTGGGFYLTDDTPRAVIRNAHRSRDTVVDENIVIRGCSINGNRLRQKTVGQPQNGLYFVGQELDRSYRSGLQFLGVHHLTVENVRLWDTLAFALWVANAKFVRVENVDAERAVTAFPEGAGVDGIQKWYKDSVFGGVAGNVQGNGPDCGLQFQGPIQYLTIDNVRLRTWDDAIALNANDGPADDMRVNNDMGPYVGQGPITDVTISNVIFKDAHHGLRMLSINQRVDRIVVQNVTGTIRGRMVVMSTFGAPAEGNFGSIAFSNVNVTLGKYPPWREIFPDQRDAIDKFERAPVAEKRTMEDPGEEGELPLFSLNARIEQLSLRNVITRVSDRDRPVIRVGANAAIDRMEVDLGVYDPGAVAIPLKLIGQIKHLDFALDWPGRQPIDYHGGAIGQLNWGSTDSYAKLAAK
jgi:hypothetical protein